MRFQKCRMTKERESNAGNNIMNMINDNSKILERTNFIRNLNKF